MSGEQKRPRRRNLDLVVHLDNRDVLVEVNVQTGDDAHVQVLFTDANGTTLNVRYSAEQAWVIGHVMELFALDRRGVLEIGQLLVEGAHEITAEEEGE